MKKKLCVVALFSLFGFLSCNNDTPEQNPVQTGDPVETNPPNTDYEPAFPGQTRIGSVKTETNIKVQEIASGVGRPWAIVSMPKDRKSTRLNSSHVRTSYAVFCLKKKKI